MKTLTYLPVNWVNGLKLTSQHFFANQYCQTEALNREAFPLFLANNLFIEI